ncbi:CGEA protein [Bacillus pfraonensis]|uniref:CGEA protein n=1 Tax=Bacillus pfraonensis TaxID=2830844 RepID=UPI003D6E611B
MANCKGIACFLFNIWPSGVIVTITTRTGQIIGPASLYEFHPGICLVILEEESSITPPSTNFVLISCEDIESVTLHS